MITKSVSDIRTDIISEFSSRLPNIDLTDGTPEREMFVEAPIAGQLQDLWAKIVYVAKLNAPHIYTNDILTEDLQTYMSNFGVVQRPASYSEGIVTFYSDTQPAEDITVPTGSIVKTRDSVPIEFEVQGTYVLYASIAASYYNANTSRWELNCAVKAVIAGPNSRAGSGTILDMQVGVAGVTGVTNADPVTGGAAEETVEEALSRVIDTFQGRGLGPTQGLVNYIQASVEAVNVVGANDPEMLRDEGLGGAIDFYIIGETLTDATEIISITSTGLLYGINVNYTSTGLMLVNQPVQAITALLINDVVIATNYYSLQKDSGMLSKSTRASDGIIITSAGLAAGIMFNAGDTVEVNYIYNSLPKKIEDDLNSEGNHYQNRDYLLREMAQVDIAVYIEFKEVSGQDFDAVASTVELDVSDFINAIKNSGSLELADVIGVIKRITTVDNVNITTVSLTPTGGGTKTEQGDILFEKNEYPVAGAITTVRWTN